MEESLRRYFLNLGYYVLRGVKFRYNTFNVTDVDLWLYAKTSALARQRTNVDIKNKKTPQALERIFWAKGLKETLALDDCMVATTDSRPDVREFGLSHQVVVLDGPFLHRLQASNKTHIDRITEEELLEHAHRASFGKIGGDWKGRYEEAKSRVLTDLRFDGCNAYINDIYYFLEAYITSSDTAQTPLRLTYSVISMFLIAVDFVLKDHSALNNDHRFDLLCEGFRYGDSGRSYATRLTQLAAGLTEVAGIAPGTGIAVVEELNRQALEIPAEALADFFSKGLVHSFLFPAACEFEAAGFSPVVPKPSMLSSNAQSIIGVLTDFLGMDRKTVLN
ncbi:hypothetical protein [Cyanobium gracile]|uniref:Uncharacterized protein n=1 Tax=Cyanobium gracile (strain ATCC 27147 / PCC 6307) TaxID=292564 RepID=K9P4A3_CYAGP|nr:hypothetical protein [Cyanobium gracile]AFY27364.1 hypothetical protein Cyagr_0155 [Cyanobium gracile PCC 6307]